MHSRLHLHLLATHCHEKAALAGVCVFVFSFFIFITLFLFVLGKLLLGVNKNIYINLESVNACSYLCPSSIFVLLSSNYASVRHVPSLDSISSVMDGLHLQIQEVGQVV